MNLVILLAFQGKLIQLETNKRKMSWNTFLSLLLVFGYNEKTATMLEMSGAFPVELKNILNVDRRKEDK